jgi:hypothetical protein
MTELCELAKKYGTDKCPELGHDYTPYYFELFNPIRYSVKKVVELGIGHPGCMWTGYSIGASLRMWRDFFPNAQIIGLDIEEKCQFIDDRIRTYRCDQTTDELEHMLDHIGQDIDIFIDDGLHDPTAQVSACLRAMLYVKQAGIYVIEDVNHGRQVAPYLTRYRVHVEERNTARYNNDRMVVVRHNES